MAPDRPPEPDPDPNTRATSDGTGGSATGINAIIGGVVAIVLSFVPLSTLLGGAVSGYLEGGTPEDGLKVGAVAGLLMFVPFALFGFFALVLLGVIDAPLVFSVIGLFVLVASAVYTVGLSALGGYLGVYIKREL